MSTVLSPTQATAQLPHAIHSLLSNPLYLPQQHPQWSIEIKVFKSTDASRSKFMYQITSITSTSANSKLIVGGKSFLTSPTESSNSQVVDLAQQVDPLDSIIQTKLQSQWTLKQSLKGDSGFHVTIFLRGKQVQIRGIGVSLHGVFRGVVVIVDPAGGDDSNTVDEVKVLLGLGEVKGFVGEWESGVVSVLGLDSVGAR